MIPYMRANLAAKREGLARADAVIAVSRRIAQDLVERAPELSHDADRGHSQRRSNVRALRAIATASGPGAARTGPYALYLGKLAPNKGTSYLVDVVRTGRPRLAAGGRRRRTGSRRARARGRGVRPARSSSGAGWTRTMPRACSPARRC